MVSLGVGEKIFLLGFFVYFLNKIFGFYFSSICFIGGLFYQFYLLSRANKKWIQLGVAGPPPKIFFGNLLETKTKGTAYVDMEWTKTYGKIFGVYFLTQPELIVADVEVLKQILVKDFNNFNNRRYSGDFFDDESIFAHLLSFTRDDEWKHIRNTITPSFTSGKMKNMTHLVNECVETFLQILSDYGSSGKSFNSKKVFGGCAMDITASVAFGTKINSQRDPDNIFVKYANEVNSFSFTSPSIMLSIFFPWTVRQILKYFNVRIVFGKAESFFKNSLTQLIKERQKNPLTDKVDFLQLLLNSSENHQETLSSDVSGKHVPMSTLQIISQSFMFLVAGYDNISNTLTWIAYLLAMNLEEQEKCYQEIKTVAGDEHITYDHIQHEMPYLEAVIAESLRLFPAAVRFDRCCNKEYELNGIRIPKMATVTIAAYAIHHDEENYPEPERFLPERFLPDEKANRNPYTYLPWGYGPRNCIGMRFAQIVMKLILANMIRKFKIVASDKTEPYPPKLNKQGDLQPLNPIFLKVQKRI